MVVVFVLVAVAVAVLGLLGSVHWYVWRRLVRDTTVAGGLPRRAGTAAAVVLPLTSLGALFARRAGAPFAVEQALAWTGYLWLALLLYLSLALLAAEMFRPLLTRWLTRRATAAGGDQEPRPADGPSPSGAGPGGPAATRVEAAPRTAASASRTAEARECAVAVPQDLPPPAAGNSGLAVYAADGGAGDADTPPGSGGGTEPSAAAPEVLTRRLFVSRAVAVGTVAVAVGTVGYGAYDVFDGPAVKRVRVPLAKLPRSADGYRIAVVSDIHLGPILGRAHTQRIVDAINRTRPDLVAIVGDLVDGSVADLGPAAEPLSRLSSRHGSYFVTGNHEYFSGAAQWVDHVRELGVHPLENARVELPGFDLAGVNDISAERQDPAQRPDYDRALGGRDPARACVLLAHQPVMIHEAVTYGVDLQLSGHTHGGQLWPGHYLAALANPTVVGLERYGDTQLYVTRGAGAWGPPVRVGAEPDITLVTLAAARRA